MAEGAPARSLRRRLTLSLVAATLAIGAVALVDTGAEARRTARDVSDRVLVGSALAIAEGITLTAEGEVAVAIPFSALAMLTSAAQDQVFYRVDGPAGLLTGYADLGPAEVAGEAGFADAAFRGTAIRTVTLVRELTTGEGLVPVRVTVAESTRARAGLARQILAGSAIRIGLLIAGAAVVAWVAATVALRPADRLSRLLADRAPHDLSPVAAPAPAELAPVLAALNGFLARLQGTIQALLAFAAHANHQIRTPLTVARTQIAVARKGGTATARAEALDKADAALVRSERVLAQLLVLARVQATGARPALVPRDVAALARGVVEDLLPLALLRGQDLGYDGPDSAMAATEEVLLGELLRNLADNALRHCPAGTVVTITLVPGPGGLRLTVADTGPPLPEAAFAVLCDRLLAAPPRGGGDPGGHGLGLLIVGEIARTLGIGLAVARGGSGGLAVTLDLPGGRVAVPG
jgi:two-component system sensor histidine kinase TctE